MISEVLEAPAPFHNDPSTSHNQDFSSSDSIRGGGSALDRGSGSVVRAANNTEPPGRN